MSLIFTAFLRRRMLGDKTRYRRGILCMHILGLSACQLTVLAFSLAITGCKLVTGFSFGSKVQILGKTME